jgi:DNA-binding transcriptional MerR regulator
MAENKSLGIENLGSVDWLNDSAPEPQAAEETQTPETTEAPEPVAETVEAVEEAAPEVTPEETSEEVADDFVEDEAPALDPVDEPVAEANMFSTLSEKLGYEVEGDFAEDYDGLANYTTAVGEQIANERLQKMFEQYPDVAEYFQYRSNNGDPLKYFEAQQAELDYNSIEIDDNLAVQKRVVIDGMRQAGFGDSEIGEMVDDLEDTGLLKKQAGRYLSRLQATQATRKEQLLAQQAEQAQQQRAEAEAYWSSVQDTINTGNLKGLGIPQRQRGKFFDWMTNPVADNGATQRDLDRQNIDQETALAVEYLLFQGFDLKKLATSAAATQKVSTLKSKLSSAPSAGSRLKSRTKSGTTKPTGIPSLKDLL